MTKSVEGFAAEAAQTKSRQPKTDETVQMQAGTTQDATCGATTTYGSG